MQMREISYIKRALLRGLSENARATVTELAKAANCSRNSALSNLRALEGEFGLRYSLDFNKDLLGLLQRHIIRVKLSEKIAASELEEMFDDDITQLLAMTEGDFDLLIVAEAPSGQSYMRWETQMAMKLAPSRPVIRPSQIVATHIGFIPVQQRTLEQIDLSSLGFDDVDKKILLSLNSDSRRSYREIAKEVGIKEDMLRYRFRQIMKSGIVQGFSAIVTKPPTQFNIAFFVNYSFAPGTERRAAIARSHYMQIDDKLPVINRFQFLAPLSGSYRFFGIGCFDDKKEALRQAIDAHKQAFREDRPAISFARIEKVVRGLLPIRNIDVAKSYKVIKWQ